MVALPWQLFVVLVAVAPKPSGDEKPIALKALFLRLLLRLYRQTGRDWEDAHDGFGMIP